MTRPNCTIDILINDLQAEVARRKLTKKGLAELAHLHANTLKNFGKDGWCPSIYTLRALERALLPGSVQLARAA
jgi:hypothetical protein